MGLPEMARHKDANWNLGDKVTSWEEVAVSVLMDIRDELKHINRRLDCPSTSRAAYAAAESANALRRIDKRLAKKIALK